MKKKILINDYAGHPFITMLSAQLALKNYEVLHSYFADDKGPKGIMKSDIVKFIGIRNTKKYSKSNFLRRRSGDIEYGNQIKKLIDKEKPDVVFSSNTPVEAQEIILKSTKKIKSKFVFWCQDFYSVAAKKILSKKLGFIGNIIGSYYSFLEQKQFKSADHIIAITEDFLKLFKEFNVEKEKISIIQNWGSIDEINLTDKNNSWAKKNKLDHKRFRILYSGTLGFKHNPKYIERLAKENPDIDFLIIGTGVGFDYLKNLPSVSNMILMPLQPMSCFSEVLGSADVCMAVLEDDAGIFSVPSKVLSYLCAGKPIIMHGPEENLASKIIHDNNCGLISNGDDYITLNKNIDLLKDKKRAETMARNSREYAIRNFSIEKICANFMSIINS